MLIIKNLNLQSKSKPYLGDSTDDELESPFAESHFFLLTSKFEGNKKYKGVYDQNNYVFMVTSDSVSTGRFLFAFRLKLSPENIKILKITSVQELLLNQGF